MANCLRVNSDRTLGNSSGDLISVSLWANSKASLMFPCAISGRLVSKEAIFAVAGRDLETVGARRDATAGSSVIVATADASTCGSGREAVELAGVDRDCFGFALLTAA